MESEFGKGFVYCLFLFAKHFERKPYKNSKGEEDWGMFFNGAADHFFEMEIPKQFQRNKIGKLAKELIETGLKYRHAKVAKEQAMEFYEKCEELTRLIDINLGIKSIKAEWN